MSLTLPRMSADRDRGQLAATTRGRQRPRSLVQKGRFVSRLLLSLPLLSLRLLLHLLLPLLLLLPPLLLRCAQS